MSCLRIGDIVVTDAAPASSLQATNPAATSCTLQPSPAAALYSTFAGKGGVWSDHGQDSMIGTLQPPSSTSYSSTSAASQRISIASLCSLTTSPQPPLPTFTLYDKCMTTSLMINHNNSIIALCPPRSDTTTTSQPPIDKSSATHQMKTDNSSTDCSPSSSNNNKLRLGKQHSTTLVEPVTHSAFPSSLVDNNHSNRLTGLSSISQNTLSGSSRLKHHQHKHHNHKHHHHPYTRPHQSNMMAIITDPVKLNEMASTRSINSNSSSNSNSISMSADLLQNLKRKHLRLVASNGIAQSSNGEGNDLRSSSMVNPSLTSATAAAAAAAAAVMAAAEQRRKRYPPPTPGYSTHQVPRLAKFVCALFYHVWMSNSLAETLECSQKNPVLLLLIQHILATTRLPLPTVTLAMKYVQRLRRLRGAAPPHPADAALVLALSLVLAQKYSDDNPYGNKLWGKVINVAPRDLTKLEVRLLQALQYRLCVSAAEYNAFCRGVQALAREWNKHWVKMTETPATAGVASNAENPEADAPVPPHLSRPAPAGNLPTPTKERTMSLPLASSTPTTADSAGPLVNSAFSDTPTSIIAAKTTTPTGGVAAPVVLVHQPSAINATPPEFSRFARSPAPAPCTPYNNSKAPISTPIHLSDPSTLYNFQYHNSNSHHQQQFPFPQHTSSIDTQSPFSTSTPTATTLLSPYSHHHHHHHHHSHQHMNNFNNNSLSPNMMLPPGAVSPASTGTPTTPADLSDFARREGAKVYAVSDLA